MLGLFSYAWAILEYLGYLKTQELFFMDSNTLFFGQYDNA